MFTPETLLNNLDEAVLLFDASASLIYANRAAEELLGKSLKEAKGKEFSSLFGYSENLVRFMETALAEGRTFSCKDTEIKNNDEAGADVNIMPFYDYSVRHKKFAAGPDGAIVCIRRNLSLTEREDYHFDSLLFLIGSIAHEIKNPLGGIKGAAQLLRSGVSGKEADECIDLIIRESDRLNSVLSTYLTMTRKPVFNRLNIHEVLEQAIRVIDPLFRDKKARLIKVYDPSLPVIMGDEAKLLQVFINLLKNAAESLGRRERLITITTGPSSEYMVIQDPDRFFRVYGPAGLNIQQDNIKSRKQRWVVVDIKDTGAGIPQEEMQRIFLPFYTKKEGGSGLGLALSKKIVKDHGGLIKVRSRLKQGTVMSVYLPFSIDQEQG
ncbi:MAG: PAS domain-containing protein [Nitrospiraceae bacterium]|nr:PAS domain-containing protein [Nitrospiraceae bacterium]